VTEHKTQKLTHSHGRSSKTNRRCFLLYRR